MNLLFDLTFPLYFLLRRFQNAIETDVPKNNTNRARVGNSWRTREVKEIVTSDWSWRGNGHSHQLYYSLEQPLIIDARMQTSKLWEKGDGCSVLIAQVICKALRDFAAHST